MQTAAGMPLPLVMILALDIGNTDITAGVFSAGEKDLRKAFSLPVASGTKSLEYASELAERLEEAGLGTGEIEAAVVASVVPALDEPLRKALVERLGVKFMRVGSDIPFGMEILTDNPEEVGDDRIVNAVAAFEIYGGELIVVDFGTAITFDYVTAGGGYAGGVIAPGIGISAEALFTRAAKLSRVEVTRPHRVVGTNTAESMRSGLYWGFLGLVDGVIERMTAEVGRVRTVVSTGGMAGLISKESSLIGEVDELLTLKGLKLLYERSL